MTMMARILLVGAATCAAACGGLTTRAPTAPSSAIPAGSINPVPAGPQTPGDPRAHRMAGSVEPLDEEGNPPCWAERYPCVVYDFSIVREGPIEVTLTWEGAPRALMVQLYWAGEGLAHEDVAPLSGPSRIWFVRPRMEAAAYRLRVVSLEPASTIPFTLTVTY